MPVKEPTENECVFTCHVPRMGVEQRSRLPLGRYPGRNEALTERCPYRCEDISRRKNDLESKRAQPRRRRLTTAEGIGQWPLLRVLEAMRGSEQGFRVILATVIDD